MDNWLVRKIDELAAQPDGIRSGIGRYLLTIVDGPKRQYNHVQTDHLQTSHTLRTEIPIGDEVRKYIIGRWYQGLHSFVEFSSGVRTRISGDLHERIMGALANGEIQDLEHVRLRNNGFYADADVLPEGHDYSLRVITIEDNPK